MVTFQKKRSYMKMLLKPLFFCGVLTYLVFHALNGNHGVYALLKEQRRLETREQEYSNLMETRQMAERRVALLSDGSLDLDLLDERARIVLGYAGKDEVVLVPPSSGNGSR